MKYEKPEMTRLEPAISVIQGGKGITSNPDNHSDTYVTMSAYEADE